jgi:large subunit ribosomal protein L9
MRAEAEQHGAAIDGKAYVLIRQAGESGQLYGSVSARDIAEILIADNHPVARNAVQMEKPIKAIGVYTVKVRLHAEVVKTITMNVARSQDEADRQSKGENVIAANAAAERAEENARNAELAAVAAEAAAERGPVEG